MLAHLLLLFSYTTTVLFLISCIFQCALRRRIHGKQGSACGASMCSTACLPFWVLGGSLLKIPLSKCYHAHTKLWSSKLFYTSFKATVFIGGCVCFSEGRRVGCLSLACLISCRDIITCSTGIRLCKAVYRELVLPGSKVFLVFSTQWCQPLK